MKDLSRLNILGPFLILTVLMGAGCQASPSYTDCKITPWNSCINSDGIDDALTGEWILESETISKAGQSFTTPLHGRVTTFSTRAITSGDQDSGFIDERGTFSEDFNTETGVDANVNAQQTTCEVVGENTGDYFIDVTTDEPLAPGDSVSVVDLILYIQPTNGEQKLTCASDGTDVESSGTSTPLGNSFFTSNGVRYSYEISSDWQTLTLKNRNPADVLITYVFRAK